MAQAAPPVLSILAADFGSVNTRVTLYDIVGGKFRLVARAQTLTTDMPPLVDAGIGLRRALAEIAQVTGSSLITNNEDALELQNTDLFLATASGGRPMKAVLVGLMPDVSVATGRRALASTYVELTDTLSLGDARSQTDQVNAILRNQPDLILIVGGTNDGATESMIALIKTVQLAVILARSKPVVVYAGNEALKPKVKELLNDQVDLFMTNNVRPTIYNEQLAPVQLELSMAYGNFKAAGTGGFEQLQHAARMGVQPTAQSYANVVRYLGELPGSGIGVLVVDVGSSTVTVCASVRKQSSIMIRPDLGLGHSAVSGVKIVGAKNVLRWLTFPAKEGDVIDYAYNKTLHPSTVPQTQEDLEMEYAIARELIRNAVAGARGHWPGTGRGDVLPAMRPIIGAGAVLANAIDPGIGGLLLLDALQPVGVAELRLDPYGVIAALGGMAYVEPAAMVQIIETGGLVNLGTAICPLGKARGTTAMEVTVKIAGGRAFRKNVNTGFVQTVDIPAGQRAQVSIKLSPGLSLNGKNQLTLTVEGGAVGLILDGRGRPFTPPSSLERRAQIIPRWYSAVRSKA